MTSGNETKQIVSVIGMHRSGTSCVARGLQALGVHLGAQMVLPAKDNPKGFWEDDAILSINDQLLATRSLAWDTLQAVPLKSQSDIMLMSNAICLLNSRLRGAHLFGFKDPRTTRLLFFWQKIFADLNLNDSYVIVVRNPFRVALSLKERNGFDIQKSLLLWILHVLPSLQMTQDKKRVVVDYDLLLQRPSHQLKRIATALDLQIIPEELVHYENSFLDSSLNHHTCHKDILREQRPFGEIALELYNWLWALAEDQLDFDHPFLMQRWQALNTQVTSLDWALPHLEGLYQKALLAEQKIKQLRIDLMIASSLRIRIRKNIKAFYKKYLRKKERRLTDRIVNDQYQTTD